MKKVDKLLLKSFISPFLVAFLIALFVLVMQFLWVYIDDIIGKGASILMLSELIFYLSISLFPMALPIGVLMASVMVMGNLAERYELASFKSAGVPLIRVMLPIAVFAFGISIFSFICANNLIPIANLQFKSRLYDIRKQKPTLSLEQGVFNDDFQGYSIYIGNKLEDGRGIEDVIIYKQSNTEGRLSSITAERGEMYTTADDNYFIMNLYNGIQNEETGKRFEKGKRNYSFSRTKFRSYRKVFDLGQFSISDTDKQLFKSHQTMLSVGQLSEAIDSIDAKIENRHHKMEKHVLQYLYLEKKLDTLHYDKKKVDSKTVSKSAKKYIEQAKKDSVTQDSKVVNTKPKPLPSKGKKDYKPHNIVQKPQVIPNRKTEKERAAVAHFRDTFKDVDQKKLLNKVKSYVRSIHSHAAATNRVLEKEEINRIKHVYEKHMKFSMALVCFVFLFIGGAMGAIVRKGGFGYPFLIAIFVFVLYIVLMIVFEELAEEMVLPVVLASWLPILILTPIATYLTYQAMHDAQLFNIKKLTAFFDRIQRLLGGAS